MVELSYIRSSSSPPSIASAVRGLTSGNTASGAEAPTVAVTLLSGIKLLICSQFLQILRKCCLQYFQNFPAIGGGGRAEPARFCF